MENRDKNKMILAAFGLEARAGIIEEMLANMLMDVCAGDKLRIGKQLLRFNIITDMVDVNTKDIAEYANMERISEWKDKYSSQQFLYLQHVDFIESRVQDEASKFYNRLCQYKDFLPRVLLFASALQYNYLWVHDKKVFKEQITGATINMPWNDYKNCYLNKNYESGTLVVGDTALVMNRLINKGDRFDVQTKYEEINGLEILGVRFCHNHFSDMHYCKKADENYNMWLPTAERTIVDEMKLGGNEYEPERIMTALKTYMEINSNLDKLREVAAFYDLDEPALNYWIREVQNSESKE